MLLLLSYADITMTVKCFSGSRRIFAHAGTHRVAVTVVRVADPLDRRTSAAWPPKGRRPHRGKDFTSAKKSEREAEASGNEGGVQRENPVPLRASGT